jgi:hypothetical protein
MWAPATRVTGATAEQSSPVGFGSEPLPHPEAKTALHNRPNKLVDRFIWRAPCRWGRLEDASKIRNHKSF